MENHILRFDETMYRHFVERVRLDYPQHTMRVLDQFTISDEIGELERSLAEIIVATWWI